MKRRPILIILILSIIFFNWKSQNPKILFLTLKLEKGKVSQSEKVSLVNKIIVDGHFKGSYASKISNSKSTLQLIFLSESSRIIHQIEIDNPLDSGIESFDINGTMQRNFVDQNSVEFNVRVVYDETINTLKINKVDVNNQIKNLSTLTLKL